MMIQESTCRLAGDRLAGIVTTPTGAERRGACVLVNAGVVAKHGPFRLYVELARRLARDGYTTLRFDLGGLGDSAASAARAPVVERTRGEIASAVDHVAAAGSGPVIVGGLCSGAEDAFRYAERDPRVTGVVLVDPFAYRTPGWYPRDFARRASGKALLAVGAFTPLPLRTRGARLVDYQYMPRRESTRILGALLDRGVRLHFVYTGGSADKFNHAGQLAAMFPTLALGDQVTLDHLPGIEHTQLLSEDRERLVEAIGTRLAAW
jgi:pimeloyl-ACP methyl ester carboxylesterase|nr:alpha/beta hydrolase [Kofleriaceae bacterium]